MLSENAQQDVEARLTALQEQNGGTLAGLKADDAWRAAYPDNVDLFDWRREWTRFTLAEEPGQLAAHPAPAEAATDVAASRRTVKPAKAPKAAPAPEPVDPPAAAK